MMSKKRKLIIISLLVVILAGLAIVLSLWFKPHRDVQSEKVYATMKLADLTDEFSADPVKANAKYLSEDGNSKVLIIEGRVSKISTNQVGEIVILLKDKLSKVGVSATFTQKTNANAKAVKEGDIVRIKGAITAGNSYDKDLDLYENAILLQCDIVK